MKRKIGNILSWLGYHEYDDEWGLEETWEGDLIEINFCERCGSKTER
jgi:hypothetical protein